MIHKIPSDFIAQLQQRLDANAKAPEAPHDTRCYHLSALLLLCDFNIGTLIRTLKGFYISDHLQIEKIMEAMDFLDQHYDPPSASHPAPNFEQAKILYTQGAPLRGEHTSLRNETLYKDIYNNHPSIPAYADNVRAMLAKDVQCSYTIAFPRWVHRFIDGLFLACLGYALRETNDKIKHRVVWDPSVKLHGPSDTSAVNHQIDKKDRTRVPRIFYQTALSRLWRRLWNLRIRNPEEPISLYKDDIVSAFRRISYHPDMCQLCSFVFESYWCIPVGMTFGLTDSPGNFSLLSDIRAIASSEYDPIHSLPIHPIIDKVDFSPLVDVSTLAKAEPDSQHTGLSAPSLGEQPCFVDDTLMAEYTSHIRQAASSSIHTCDIFFGNPSMPELEPPISTEKFETQFKSAMEMLGFDINTHTMTVSIPPHKMRKLIKYLNESGILSSSRPYCVFRLIVQINGILRHFGAILPISNYSTIRLQSWIDTVAKKEYAKFADSKSAHSRLWRPTFFQRIPSSIISDIKLLVHYILHEPTHHLLQRPIGTLISRDPLFEWTTDASNQGLGGWSTQHLFQWRLSIEDLLSSSNAFQALLDETPEALHINVLEFLAIYISTWLGLKLIHQKILSGEPISTSQGVCFHIHSDNTSAISWMYHASRTSRQKHVQNLSRAFQTLLLEYDSLFYLSFESSHIKGDENGPADALSRPRTWPSFNDVWSDFPTLSKIPTYQIPSEVLQHLGCILSQQRSEDMYVNATRALLQVEPLILTNGAST